MKAITLLLVALLGLAVAEPITATKLEPEKLQDSNDFIANVQGDNENMYIVVFETNEEDYTADIQAALDGAPDDEKLSTLDIFQDSFDGSWEIFFGQVDARDEVNYSEALHVIGADSDDFQMTYPVYLITKKGKGVLGSLTAIQKDGTMTAAFKEKFIKISGAQKAKAQPAAAEEPPVEGEPAAEEEAPAR